MAQAWPSPGAPSPGARCSTPGGPTSGSCARRSRARASRELVADPRRPAPAVVAGLRARRDRRQLYAHQAEALEAAWQGPTIVTTGTASGKSLCFNLPTLDVLCTDAQGARALPLPDEGAGPGPSARAERARAAQAGPARDLRRRHEARGATRRSAGARTSSSRTPTCSTSGSCPTTGAGATSSRTSPSSWSTRRTSTAACSARTSRTCCAGCGVSPPPTGPSRGSCSPARRSPTPSSSPSGSRASTTSRSSTATARPARGGRSRCGTRRSSTRRCRRGAAPWPRRPRWWRSWSAAGRGRSASSSRRKAVELVARLVRDELGAGRRPVARRPRRPLPRRLHAPAAPRARGEAQRAATSSPSSPPTRSSSGSTSARSTPPSASRSRARSRRCARCGGGRGAAGAGLAVYVAGEDALDQFFCRHPDEFLERPVEAAISAPRERARSTSRTCSAPRMRGRWPTSDAEFLGPRWRAYADLLVAAGELVQRRGQYVLRRPEDFPAARVSLRSASPDNFTVVDVSAGRDARDGRDGARALDRPRRRGVPAPGALVRGARARPRRPPRARHALRRRLVHAAQEGDDDRDRAAARPARDAGRRRSASAASA